MIFILFSDLVFSLVEQMSYYMLGHAISLFNRTKYFAELKLFIASSVLTILSPFLFSVFTIETILSFFLPFSYGISLSYACFFTEFQFFLILIASYSISRNFKSYFKNDQTVNVFYNIFFFFFALRNYHNLFKSLGSRFDIKKVWIANDLILKFTSINNYYLVFFLFSVLWYQYLFFFTTYSTKIIIVSPWTSFAMQSGIICCLLRKKFLFIEYFFPCIAIQIFSIVTSTLLLSVFFKSTSVFQSMSDESIL